MVNTLDSRSRPDDDAHAMTTPLTAESLLALVPDAMLVVDADGAIVALNRLAEILFGYAPGELVGAPVENLMPEAVRGRHAAHRAGFMGTPEMRAMGAGLELCAVRKDGREVPVEITLSLLSESDAPLVAAMVRDVTAHKTVEHALQFSEERMHEAAKLAQIGHFVSNVEDGRMLFCSDEYARIFGCSVDECLTLCDTGSGSTAQPQPEESERLRREAYDGLLRNGNPIDIRYRITRRDGTIRHVRERTRVVADEGSQAGSAIGTIQDITDEVEANRALAERESLLTRAADVAGLGHYVRDAASETLNFVSEQYARIRGRSVGECLALHATEEGGLGDVHPDDREAYRRVRHSVANDTAQILDFIYRIVRPDGEIRHVHEREDPVFEESGLLVRYVGTLQDITERVHAEQVLRENEERLAEAARIARLGHFVFSKENGTGRMEMVSDEYAQIYGLSIEECLDTMFDIEGLLAVVHPDDRDRYRKAKTTDLTSESGPLDIDYRIVRPDGALRHIRERGRPEWNADGSFRKIVGTIQDVSDGIEAEQALQTSEENFSGVVENVPGAVFRQAPDEAGTFTFVSEGIRDLAGYEPGDLVGQPMAFLAHPDDYGKLTETALEHIRSGLPMNIEYRIRHKDGSEVWVREISRMVTSASGGQTSFDGVLVDITDRKSAEEALAHATADLRESEERYARAVAGTNDAIWDWEIATGDCYLAPRYFRMLGYEPSEFASHLDVLIERIHPDDRTRVEDAMRRHVESDDPYDVEYRLRQKDGDYIWVRARGQVQRNSGGTPVRMAGSTSDITEIKLFEEQLRQSEIEFRGIFDGMPLSVWYEDWSEPKRIIDGLREQGVTDLTAHFRTHPELVQELYELTRVLRFNQATQEIYKADEETLWRDIDTFDFDEEREAYGDMLAVLGNGACRMTYETKELNYEDEEITIRVNVHIPPEFRGDWSRVIVTSEDVTAVKNTEEQLRLSEIEFRGIFDGMPISVWYEDWNEPKKIIDELRTQGVTDFRAHFRANPDLIQDIYEKSRVLRFNQATMDIYNTDAETLWRDVDRFDFPEEREAYGDMLAILAEGVYRTSYETKEFNYEDGEITVRANVHIPPEFHKDWARVVVTAEDISGAKAIEEQLHQSQKMEAVGQLTGGVAHDFNNLLGIMLGNAELLADNLNDKRLLNFANAIKRAALRGAELTHGLLAFSRRQSLEPQRVDLAKMVNGVTSILQRTLGAAIRVETRAADAEVVADVDPSQIENALLNLTINARDAMPDGGVLHIETRLADLDADAARQIDAPPGRYAVLSVADTGAGMPPEVLERVFEPFFTTKDTGKGTGLGLSMVYGFVKQSEGHITIHSTEGQGTVICLYLPVSGPVENTQIEPGDAKVSPKGRGETVLLVEDDSEFRALSVGLLENLGYRTVVAEDAATAFRALANEQDIDLVLTDVVLPGGKSGADVSRAVQARRPDVPVLFMSGYTAGNLDALQSEDGSDLPLIRKPFSRHLLAHRLRELLTGEAAE